MWSLALIVSMLIAASVIRSERAESSGIVEYKQKKKHQLEQDKLQRKYPLKSNQYLLRWLNRPGGSMLEERYASMLFEFVVPVKCRHKGLWLRVGEKASQDKSQLAHHCVLVECGRDTIETQEVPCPKRKLYSGPDSVADRFIDFGDFMTVKTDQEPGFFTVYSGVQQISSRYVYAKGRVRSEDDQGVWAASEDVRVRLTNDGFWANPVGDCRDALVNPGLTEPVDESSAEQCKQDAMQRRQTCFEEVQMVSGKSAPWIAKAKRDKYLTSHNCMAWHKSIEDSSPKVASPETRATKGYLWKSAQYKCEEDIDQAVKQLTATCHQMSDTYCTDELVISCLRSPFLPTISHFHF